MKSIISTIPAAILLLSSFAAAAPQSGPKNCGVGWTAMCCTDVVTSADSLTSSSWGTSGQGVGCQNGGFTFDGRCTQGPDGGSRKPACCTTNECWA